MPEVGPVRRARVRQAGDAALLIELEPIIDIQVNARAVAIAGALRRRALNGVRDIVPAYRSVAVHVDPMAADMVALWSACESVVDEPSSAVAGRLVELPVRYGGSDGPDLPEIAAATGLSEEEIVRRHSAVDYRVFMLGFQPGFAYLGIVDKRIAATRRATPRVGVPKGSVGIAGRQTGVYPRESPGGWQIIGHTDADLFDVSRSAPSLLEPGDIVRFVPTATTRVDAGVTPSAPPNPMSFSAPVAGKGIAVIAPGLFTTVQDLGRWGHQHIGIAVAGAMDHRAHIAANRVLGNDDDAATLEVTLSGPELRFEEPTRIAIAGAALSPDLDGQPVPSETAVVCRAGSVLRFGQRVAGARAYIAFDGGVDVPLVLGSRSTHTGSGIGGFAGRALRAGDRLALCTPAPRDAASAPPRTAARRSRPTGSPIGAPAAGPVRLRVLPGPQRDHFGADALDTLGRTRFRVSSQSNRMGYRLSGATLPASGQGEMISDATFAGGIQVPPSGEPILLMADRQTTGGYPQLAIVISADLPAAGQLAPDDWVVFAPCDLDTARAALEAEHPSG
jgi:KipI family sensor histidine kinase inhibitor